MSPHHSSPAPADSRCRDALQVNLCAEYKLVHSNVYIKGINSRHNLPDGGLKSYSVTPCHICDRRKNTESVFRPQNIPECNGLTRPLAGCSSGAQRRITPIDNHIKFNRMNGSPGDPPAYRMHIYKQKESLLLITVSRVIHPARRPAGRQQHKEI